MIKNLIYGSPYYCLLSHALYCFFHDPSLLLYTELDSLHENRTMAITNNFTEPPPQTHPGDYSFASTIQYGSTQEITWIDNYSFPLTLILWQETYFLDDNTISPQTETLACTVPLLPMPLTEEEEADAFCFFSFSQPRQHKLLLGRQTNTKPFSE